MHIKATLAAAVLAALSTAAQAEDFDGSKRLICASDDAISCVPGGDCDVLTIEEMNVPPFFHLDFAGKSVSATRPDGEQRTTEIQTMEVHEGELVLQGMQGGRGWTAAITLGTGKMSLSAVGDQVAFVVFGNCTADE